MQINGRGVLTSGETLGFSMEYVRTRNVMLDLKILAITLKQVLFPRGVFEIRRSVLRPGCSEWELGELGEFYRVREGGVRSVCRTCCGAEGEGGCLCRRAVCRTKGGIG
jgi:hypothetical protein